MKNKLAQNKNGKQKSGEKETEAVKDEDHSILELRLKNCRTVHILLYASNASSLSTVV